LRLGADDYLCKPFALIEVAARLEALVRRSHGQARNELRHGKVTLDPASLIAKLERRNAGSQTQRVRAAGTADAQRRARAAAQTDRREALPGTMTSPAMPSKFTCIICAASSAVILSAPCTASVIPWVTHETDPTPEPEAAPDAALVLSLAAWFAASIVAWHQTTRKLDKLFDTQQMLFAKRLLAMDLNEIQAPKRMSDIPKSETWSSGR
jgi:hypothetical protein